MLLILLPPVFSDFGCGRQLLALEGRSNKGLSARPSNAKKRFPTAVTVDVLHASKGSMQMLLPSHE
jgi:hypothetical protein